MISVVGNIRFHTNPTFVKAKLGFSRGLGRSLLEPERKVRKICGLRGYVEQTLGYKMD
jgi:hypothetical protein